MSDDELAVVSHREMCGHAKRLIGNAGEVGGAKYLAKGHTRILQPRGQRMSRRIAHDLRAARAPAQIPSFLAFKLHRPRA